MDKAAIIFSILTHDYDFMLLFWLFVTFPVGIWHIFYFPTKKQFTAKQLVEISPKFKHIDSDYLVFSFLGLGIFVLLPALILFNNVDDWSVSNLGMKFYPAASVFSVGYAMYQALFALLQGVYPMAKSLSYAYDEEVVIRRVARYQIVIALAAFGLEILFFFITVR